LALGGAVYLFELLVLPLLGATPRLRRWPAGDKLRLAGHTGLYGLATEMTFRSLEPA
jgi:fumarate reductase subunit D